MANLMSDKPNVEVNGVVIEELKGADVDVALTRAQQAKVGIPLMARVVCGAGRPPAQYAR
jgi:hypothetical protein